MKTKLSNHLLHAFTNWLLNCLEIKQGPILGLTIPVQNESGYAKLIGTNFSSFIFHHTNNISTPSRKFLGINIFYISSSPVSSKLGSMGPTMWSIFPSITLHFSRQVYLQVLLQFQSFSRQRRKEQLRAKKNQEVYRHKYRFFFVKVKLFCLNVTFISALKFTCCSSLSQRSTKCFYTLQVWYKILLIV